MGVAARGGVKRRSKATKGGFLKTLGSAIGGNKTPDFDFTGSDTLDEVGWYWQNSGDKPLDGKWNYEKVTANNCRTRPVKTKKPNELGLYDMSGNVWEWCWDWFDWDFYEECRTKGTVQNPMNNKGSDSGRVLRGGSWDSSATNSRVSLRYWLIPNLRDNNTGFRVAQDFPKGYISRYPMPESVASRPYRVCEGYSPALFPV